MKDIKNSGESNFKKAIIDFLINIPLFDGLNSNELSIVAEHMNFFELVEGEILFREGEKGDYVCFVVNGILDVIKQSASGQHVMIATLSKGRSIGEMAIIDKTSRSATVKARKKSTLVTLSGKRFDGIIDKHPKIGTTILKGMARLLSLNMRKTSSRLADYMLTMG